MRVIHLNGIRLVKGMESSAAQLVNAQHVLQGTGGEEVLLLQPQNFSTQRFVIGVEDLAYRLGGDFLVHGVVVIAFIKRLKIERIDRLGGPEPEKVGHVGAIARDGNVVGDAADELSGYPADAEMTVLVVILLGISAGA